MTVRFVDSSRGEEPSRSGGRSVARVSSLDEARARRSSATRGVTGDQGGASQAASSRVLPESGRSTASATPGDPGRGGGASVADGQVRVEDAVTEVCDAIVVRLRRRGLSESEVLKLALEHGLDTRQANDVLDRLRGWGYIDDAELARQVTRQLRERKGYGQHGIRRALVERSIRTDIIEEILESDSGDDELARAIDVAAKRQGQLRGLDHEAAERRLTGYLLRRGYSGSVVRAAVGQTLAGMRSSSVSFRET